MIKTLIQTFGAGCDPSHFFGLVPWYKYLDLQEVRADNGNVVGCEVNRFTVLGANSDIPLVLLAVVDNLLRIAGLIAVGFIIYGAVMYVTSQGSPDQTSKAQTTIVNALAGLVITIIAVVVVTFVGNRLG